MNRNNVGGKNIVSQPAMGMLASFFALLVWQQILVVVVVIGVIAAIIYGIVFVSNAKDNLSTDKNNERKKLSQVAALDLFYTMNFNAKKGIAEAFKPVPAEQKMLINSHVLGMRNIGYLGPYEYGVYDEKDGVRYALSSGARCLILDIDYYKSIQGPALVMRDRDGVQISNNYGSIKKVCQAIADNTFTLMGNYTPFGLSKDPLIVVLNIHSSPDMVQDQAGYIRFLRQIGKQVQPLQKILLGNTPKGDYRRHAKAGELWFTPIEQLRSSCIVLCNLDTSILQMTESYKMGKTTFEEDLDYIVHGFVAKDMNKLKDNDCAVISTSTELLTTPTQNISDRIKITKSKFTIILDSDTQTLIEKAKLEKLLKIYGVHCVPINTYSDETAVGPWLQKNVSAGGLYSKNSWVIKDLPLRYIPPKPIVTVAQSTKVNTNMGAGPGKIVLK
jgi:hypothetical protein